MDIREKFTKVFKTLFYENWMTDDEFDKMLNEAIEIMGGWDDLIDKINIGINNGLSIDKQIEMILILFKPDRTFIQ